VTTEDIENLQMRLEYLAREFRPTQDCRDAEYRCDFHVDNSAECPCQWALKLNPDCLDILPQAGKQE
jgi:hypothetical protein